MAWPVTWGELHQSLALVKSLKFQGKKKTKQRKQTTYGALGVADVAQVAGCGRGDPEVVRVEGVFAPVGRRSQHPTLTILAGDDHLARAVLSVVKDNKRPVNQLSEITKLAFKKINQIKLINKF